jgi:hypothetical protein
MKASKGTAMKGLALALSAAALALVAIVAIPAILGDTGEPESAGPVPAAPTGRLSRTIEGVRFSFGLPAPGWTPGPINSDTDGSGFLNGSLYVSKSTVGPQGAEAVVFWASFPDGGDAVPCALLLSPPVGPSAADLAAAVARAPGTELVTGPSDVTVDGRPAKHVVLTVREDVGCDPGFFYTWHDEMWGPFWPGTNVGDTIRVWIVDVQGASLFIEAETTKEAGPDLEQEIHQIVDSIRFG